MHICGAKFQEHFFNIPEISFIQYFTTFLSCKQHDVITELICIIEKRQYPLNKKSYFKKKNAILQHFERPFK